MKGRLQQGSFLRQNTYILRDYTPWYVAFVVGGDLTGRTDPSFDSSLEISPELFSEWFRFHNDHSPVVGIHFPLEGEQLLRSMGRLGLDSHTLASGTAAYLSTLQRLVPYRECFVPIAFLRAIEAETMAPPPFPEAGRQRVARGAWLAPEPQSAWSRRHTAVDGTEGYLWYAPVYGSRDNDASSSLWDRRADVMGFKPTPQPPRRFTSLEDWLKTIRSRDNIRIVPVLAATDETKDRQLAIRIQEVDEPRGLLYQNGNEKEISSEIPEGWWVLSASSKRTQLRLEG